MDCPGFPVHHEQHALRAARGCSQFAIGDEREREFLPEYGSGGAASRGSGDGRKNAAPGEQLSEPASSGPGEQRSCPWHRRAHFYDVSWHFMAELAAHTAARIPTFWQRQWFRRRCLLDSQREESGVLQDCARSRHKSARLVVLMLLRLPPILQPRPQSQVPA